MGVVSNTKIQARRTHNERLPGQRLFTMLGAAVIPGLYTGAHGESHEISSAVYRWCCGEGDVSLLCRSVSHDVNQ